MSRFPVRFAVLVVAGLAAGCASGGKVPSPVPPSPGASAPQPELRLPYEDAGACPFECCTYGEWKVKEPTQLFRDRDRHSPVVFTAAAGEPVTGVTGIVVTHKPGRLMVKKEVTISDGNKESIRVPAGAVLPVLHYEGEGTYKVWYHGKVYFTELSSAPDAATRAEHEPELVLDGKPDDVWWVQVKNQQGQTGWTDQTDNFDGMDSCG
jgi:hypothetical protein